MIPADYLAELPDEFRVADTDRTVRKSDLANLSESELKQLWYSNKYTTADGTEHEQPIWPFVYDTFHFMSPKMSRGELLSLGMNDKELDELHAHHFGREIGALGLDPEAEDTQAMQERRKRFFDEAMARAYASTDAPEHKDGASFTPGKA